MAEIQRDVVKRDQRNAISRLFHAKDDQDAIAAWKSDLDRILHVFDVRSIGFARLLLIVSFQTELAVNIHVTVSDMRRDVSRINHNVLRIREEIGGHVHSVSMNRIRSTDNQKILTVAQIQIRSAASTTKEPSTLHLHLVHIKGYLPRCRGPVLGAKNLSRRSSISPKTSLQSPSSVQAELGKHASL